ASNKGEVTVWDSVTGRTLQILRQSSVKHALFFGNDQKIMASGGNDATLWRRRGGRFIKTARLIGHVNAVNSIAASPNGRVVATCSFDGTARVWDAGTGKLLSLLSTGESNTCFATTFSPDSTMLATVDDRKARVWRVPDGWPLMSLQSHTRPVTRLSFTPDGTRLITSTNGETVSIWDVKREPNLVASFAAENIADVEWNDQIEHLFIVDGKGHVTSMANDGASSDVQTLGHDGMTRLYFITSSRQWLQFTKSAGLRLVPESGKGPVQQLTHAGQPILHIAVNRAAGVVAASDQARVLNWRLSRDSTRPRVLNLEIGQITSMNINSSGTLLAAASKNYVTIWDLRTSMRRWMLSRHQGETEEAEVLRFSPDGRWLLSSTDDTVTLWDLAEGRKHCAADIDSPIMDATFSPDGNTFAIGTEEATFALYDSSRCTALRTLDRPDTFALDATVAFTRSGRRLLTAASDGFAELWDVETGARLQTFDNTVARDDGLPSQEENDLCFAQFNAHEDRVVLASDHNVTIWSVIPEGEALIQRAKQLVPRDFLPEELIEYGLGPSPSK
ncbi:MAG TPA: WD40 repeat domain-containing protein, partial [Thermoanaerobaculia bacterium]